MKKSTTGHATIKKTAGTMYKQARTHHALESRRCFEFGFAAVRVFWVDELAHHAATSLHKRKSGEVGGAFLKQKYIQVYRYYFHRYTLGTG